MKVNLSAYVHVEGFPRGPLFKSLSNWSFGKQSQLFPSRAIVTCLYGNLDKITVNKPGISKGRAIRTPPSNRKDDGNERHEVMPFSCV